MIHIVTKEEIQKGWSGEKKYRITDENGTPYLLRVANSSQKTKKEAEFRLMQRVAALGIPMCEPLEFGEDEEGVWSSAGSTGRIWRRLSPPFLMPGNTPMGWRPECTSNRSTASRPRPTRSPGSPGSTEKWITRFKNIPSAP